MIFEVRESLTLVDEALRLGSELRLLLALLFELDDCSSGLNFDLKLLSIALSDSQLNVASCTCLSLINHFLS